MAHKNPSTTRFKNTKIEWYKFIALLVLMLAVLVTLAACSDIGVENETVNIAKTNIPT